MNPPRAGVDAPLASSPTQLGAKGLGCLNTLGNQLTEVPKDGKKKKVS